jgi:hypothetical protein
MLWGWRASGLDDPGDGLVAVDLVDKRKAVPATVSPDPAVGRTQPRPTQDRRSNV